MVKETPNERLKEELKDNFDFNQHQLQENEESKVTQKAKNNNADDFFDTIKTSTVMTKEEK